MRRSWLVGLCIAAAFLTAGVASASAAAPEFGRCVKVAVGTGVYATGNCTSEGGEKKFEWIPGPGPNPQFTITIKAEEKHPFYLEGVTSKASITCVEATATGEITGPKTIGPISPFEWKGCEAAGIGPENKLIPAEVGAGELGVWKAGETPLKNKIGLELAPLSFDFFFTGQAFHVVGEGDIIGQLMNVNGMNTSKTFSLLATKTAKQVPERFLEEPPVSFTMTVNGTPEPAVIAWRSKITTTEKVEINTVV